jgi:hypothetical protein
MLASINGSSVPGLQARLLMLLPRIQQHATVYFRHVRCEQSRAEKIAETVALAWKWFCRLHEKGREAAKFVSALAGYAARAVHCGRRVCGQEKAHDVMSPRAQRRHNFTVERLPQTTTVRHAELYGEVNGQRQHDEYEERLRDNTVTPPPEQAAFRIDFAGWLRSLTPRERRLVKAMARNERTKDLSRAFDVSPGRISQLRREFMKGWDRFCAEPAVVAAG